MVDIFPRNSIQRKYTFSRFTAYMTLLKVGNILTANEASHLALGVVLFYCVAKVARIVQVRLLACGRVFDKTCISNTLYTLA